MIQIKNGVSFLIAVGPYAGFRIDCNSQQWRIVLGCIAVDLCWFDVDLVLGRLLDKYSQELE